MWMDAPRPIEASGRSRANASAQDDASLDLGRDLSGLADIGDHLAGHELARRYVNERLALGEHPIAVAAARHEVVGGELVGSGGIERLAVDLDRLDAAAHRLLEVDLRRDARHLREAAAQFAHLAHPIFERSLDPF